MPRFHFHLRVRSRIHRDRDGSELPDIAAAREHATAVARELMRHCAAGTRNWSIWVENEHGERELDLFFADLDPSLACYSPQTRLLMRETSRRLAALADTISAARATEIEARILIARSRGKPHLAYSRDA